MIPQLVAIDLDGTIVDETDSVSSGVLSRLAAARARGWATVLATGRTRHGATALLARHPELRRHWMVTSNGVLIYGPDGHGPVRSLLTRVLPPLVALRAAYSDLTITLEDTTGCYPCTGLRPESDFPGRQVVMSWDRLCALPCTRIFASSGTATVVDALAILGTEHYVADVYRLPDEPLWAELQHPDASKSSALEYLRARLGVLPDRTVAVGDSWNDVDMLRWAAYGVAVANAVPEALAAADARIPSCADDGVAGLLETLLSRTGAS